MNEKNLTILTDEQMASLFAGEDTEAENGDGGGGYDGGPCDVCDIRSDMYDAGRCESPGS